jgi:hypothetical protein
LQGLFGRSFRLEVRSEIGEGTTITMRIPLQIRFEVMGRSLETLATHNCDDDVNSVFSNAFRAPPVLPRRHITKIFQVTSASAMGRMTTPGEE